MKLIAWVFVSTLAFAAAADSWESLRGVSLDEAIVELAQLAGLQVIFATSGEEQIVEREPSASDPLTALDQLLEAHGLERRPGPAGTALIVAAPWQLGGLIQDIEGSPLPGVELDFDRGSSNSSSDHSGRFGLEVDPKAKMLRLFHPSYESRSIAIDRDHPELLIELIPRQMLQASIEVGPSRHTFSESPQTTFGETALASIPVRGDDPIAVTAWTQGVAAADSLATVHIRGGHGDETLVILDGIEISEPMHIRQLQPIFSVLGGARPSSVTVRTGAFPADYGNRISGVVEVTTRRPAQRELEIDLGTMMSRISLGDTNWLLAGRFWYFNDIHRWVDPGGEEVEPHFFDLFGHWEHGLGQAHRIGFGTLASKEDVEFTTDDDPAFLTLEVSSRTLWARWSGVGRARWWASSQLSFSDIDRDRSGASELDEADVVVDDRRRIRSLDLDSELGLQAFASGELRIGIELADERARYDYRRLLDDELLELDPRLEGGPIGLWSELSLRPHDRLSLQLGMRWDHHRHLDESLFGPRIGLSWRVGEHTSLRAGWGRYTQAQRLGELQVEDGIERFFPAETADHEALGIEHFLSKRLRLVFDLYRKESRQIRPRFENLFDPFDFFPEATFDRVEVAATDSHALGAELLIAGDPRGPLRWSLGYARSSVEDRIDGSRVPRSWDQPHAVNALVDLDLSSTWQATLGATWHSGWPRTPPFAFIDEEGEPDWIAGERNSARYGDYQRIDLRIARRWTLGSGSAELAIDATNLLDTANDCCIDEVTVFQTESGPVAEPIFEQWLGRVISAELRLRF